MAVITSETRGGGGGTPCSCSRQRRLLSAWPNELTVNEGYPEGRPKAGSRTCPRRVQTLEAQPGGRGFVVPPSLSLARWATVRLLDKAESVVEDCAIRIGRSGTRPGQVGHAEFGHARPVDRSRDMRGCKSVVIIGYLREASVSISGRSQLERSVVAEDVYAAGRGPVECAEMHDPAIGCQVTRVR